MSYVSISRMISNVGGRVNEKSNMRNHLFSISPLFKAAQHCCTVLQCHCLGGGCVSCLYCGEYEFTCDGVGEATGGPESSDRPRRRLCAHRTSHLAFAPPPPSTRDARSDVTRCGWHTGTRRQSVLGDTRYNLFK